MGVIETPSRSMNVFVFKSSVQLTYYVRTLKITSGSFRTNIYSDFLAIQSVCATMLLH